MRLRNVPYAKEKIDSSDYIILDYLEKTGSFYKIFANDNPIYLEIGTGKGNFIIEQAKKNPNINFIGIEKYDSVLVRALEKIGDIEIPNLRFIRMDAKDITEVFEHEISRIYLNFSDPWPKDRHAKRRLTSEEFLKRYDHIFIDKKDTGTHKDMLIYKAYKEALNNNKLYKSFNNTIFCPTINIVYSQFTSGAQLADFVAGSVWFFYENTNNNTAQQKAKEITKIYSSKVYRHNNVLVGLSFCDRKLN